MVAFFKYLGISLSQTVTFILPVALFYTFGAEICDSVTAWTGLIV